MGIANRSVVPGNWRSGERLSIKRHEGVWRDATTVLYFFFSVPRCSRLWEAAEALGQVREFPKKLLLEWLV